MSKKTSKKALVVIVAVIAIIAVVGSSLAWFVTQASKSQSFILSGIKASATVYFANYKRDVDAEKFKDENGLYTLSLNKDDENYIGKLKVIVHRSGAACCLRVKTAFEWQLADGSITKFTTNVPYVFNEEWYDNRSTDYCVYFMGGDRSGKAKSDTLYLISNFDENKFDVSDVEAGTTVKALIEVDAVQTNRYPQLWNIEKLPWE